MHDLARSYLIVSQGDATVATRFSGNNINN